VSQQARLSTATEPDLRTAVTSLDESEMDGESVLPAVLVSVLILCILAAVSGMVLHSAWSWIL
jgi:hypothetical protein